ARPRDTDHHVPARRPIPNPDTPGRRKLDTTGRPRRPAASRGRGRSLPNAEGVFAVSQLPKVKGVADIVFLLDATGSMGPCINAVKQNIKTFVQTFTTPTPNGPAVVKDWRAKVMGYRDLDYTDVPAMVANPFAACVPELGSRRD